MGEFEINITGGNNWVFEGELLGTASEKDLSRKMIVLRYVTYYIYKIHRSGPTMVGEIDQKPKYVLVQFWKVNYSGIRNPYRSETKAWKFNTADKLIEFCVRSLLDKWPDKSGNHFGYMDIKNIIDLLLNRSSQKDEELRTAYAERI